MEIAFLVLLIVLNGIFAMAEIAIISSRRSKLAKMASEGDSSAAAAIKLAEEPTNFLSTIQIGITSIGILNGIVGDAAFSEPVSRWLISLGVSEHIGDACATGLIVVLITYSTIVIGELVPKRIGQIYSESIASFLATPMKNLAIITKPFVALLSISTHAILKLIGLGDAKPPSVTEEEIHALLAEGSEAGVIEETEHEMVKNIFQLDDRQVGSFMTPIADVVYLDLSKPIEKNLALIAESTHTRFPVSTGGLRNVIGVITSKQILQQTLKGEKPNLTANLLPCVFVPETLTGMGLLEHFRTTKTQIVFVIDEYAEIQGIVTLQNLLEEVAGDFSYENTEDAWAMQREDGSWLVDGLIPIHELKEILDIDLLPEEDKGRYQTLSGMIMLLLERVPQTGDKIRWNDWRFEIIDMDGKRIDKVLISQKQPVITNPAENRQDSK